MYSKSISIQNPDRSYRIPEFVQLACRFRSKIHLHNNQGQFDAKSIMGMMAFDPTDGKLLLSAEGEDEKMAVEALSAFLLE